jgi:CheY-like chemotaxis protein
VLVIEDDADVRALLASHVARLGWRVHEAATGEEGVALAFEHRPDVVVVDILLPAMDGRDVVRTLRGHAATSAARVVVTTVLERDDVEEVPFDAVLPKPFTRADVRRVLLPLAAPVPTGGAVAS